MNGPAAVIKATLVRYGVSLTAASALLAGCGGSQLPLNASQKGPSSQQQSRAEAAYKILHEFGDSKNDGESPYAELINVKGTLYGTTGGGGSHGGLGTVFSITKTGKETVLYSFGRNGDGADPEAGLLNANGTLYGTTLSGGRESYYSAGTVFSVTQSGKEKLLHTFSSPDTYYQPNNGIHPTAGLIDVNGTFYGTTSQGGLAFYCGIVFSVTMSHKFKVLHKFCSTHNDGAQPEAALLDVNGTLYGTTYYGGLGDGTVFSITPAGDYRTLYSFGTTHDDGESPASTLINVNGTLYGTTSGGGNGGTVFSITTGGVLKTIYRFSGGDDGSNPLAGVIDVNGTLYGTTAMGGANNAGTVFSVTMSGEETVLHSFGPGDGEDPRAGLLRVGNRLYGTTYGDPYSAVNGTVFSIKL
jgi:uncharacterized repeat protein (TIGR03803 family)